MEAYLDTPTTRAFFARFGVPLISPPSGALDPLANQRAVDFETGQPVPGRIFPGFPGGPPNNNGGGLASFLAGANVTAALSRYSFLVAQYQEYLDPSYAGLGRASRDHAIPDELLLPFGALMVKYDLRPLLPLFRVFLTYADVNDTPALYMLAQFGKRILDAVLTGGFLVPGGDGSVTQLYDAVARTLLSRRRDGEDDSLFLSSRVLRVRRTPDMGPGVTVTISRFGSRGPVTIEARRLLVTVPPTCHLLEQIFDLDGLERALFDTFTWELMYAGVVTGATDTRVPNRPTLINVSPPGDGDGAGLGGIPLAPFVHSFQATGAPGVYSFRVSGFVGLLDPALAWEKVRDALTKLAGFGLINGVVSAMVVHVPVLMKVSVEDIREGFYDRLFRIQGRRATWWSGLTWAPDYSSIIWEYTDQVVQSML